MMEDRKTDDLDLSAGTTTVAVVISRREDDPADQNSGNFRRLPIHIGCPTSNNKYVEFGYSSTYLGYAMPK